MAVRTMKIECIVHKDRKAGWKELAIQSQRISNRLWQIWICHHSNNRSADKLRQHFEDYGKWKAADDADKLNAKAAKKAGRDFKPTAGEKPEWPVKALEAPLTKSADSGSFYRIISKEFPGVHVQTRGLIIKAWQSLLKKRKSTSGSLPGWVAILFAMESIPSFTKAQPIPFDKANSKLILTDDGPAVVLRVDRDPETGKSTVDTVQLMVNRKKARNARVIVDRVMSGVYPFKGSDLVFDSKTNKWFVSLAYELPVKVRPKLDPDKVLYIRPGAYTPWRVKITGKSSFWYGGRGEHVRIARKRIVGERRSRQEHYRWSGSNQKGHGRRRAEAVWTKLSSRWRDFTKQYNNSITAKVVQLAIQNGCGKIVYLPPREERVRDSRFLSKAGNYQNSRMSWEFFQFGTMLAFKCEKYGIDYGKSEKKKKPRSRGVCSVRGKVQPVD